jgi:hypothetical protein
MKKILVLACLVAILFAGKVLAQTGAPGFSIYNFNSAWGLQISLWAAGSALSTTKVDSGHFLTGSPQGKVQLKPNASVDDIQYVSLTGSDGNDGQSWGTAKLTIFNALQALPGGSTSPPTAGYGTVYVSGGFFSPHRDGRICGTSNGGVWLMGQGDPNYANPPCGWLRTPSFAGGLNIIGVPRTQGGPNPHTTAVIMSQTGDPSFWLSNTNQAINISNIAGGGGNRFAVIGLCSDGITQNGQCQTTNAVFTSVSGSVNTSSGSAGPCATITGGSFWIWFRDFGCSGNASGASDGLTANNAAAILIDGTGGNSGNGLITIRDSNLANGGIKSIGVSGSLVVDNVTQEGDFVHPIPPTVWLTNWVNTANLANLSNILSADTASGSMPAVQIDNPQVPIGPPLVIVENSSFLGPAIALNSNSNTSGATPLRQGQIGFFSTNIVGQTDVARRNDALVAARFLNRASSNTATWTSNDAAKSTIRTGLTDPFGGTGAAKIVHNVAGTANFNLGSSFPYTAAVGDWLVFGVWEQGMGGDINLNNQPSGCGGLTASQYYQDNGYQYEDRWSFRWKAQKMSTATSTCIQVVIKYSNVTTPTLYGPVMYVIPNGTLSDNEVVDFASSMATTDIACPIGSICNPAGHPVQLTALSLNGSNQLTSVSGNSGQVAQSSGTLSKTKLKTADANGNIVDAGGSGTLGITFPSKTYASSAICNNTAAASAWNLPTSAAPTVSCRTGTNTQEGTLNFADADSAQFSLPLASDWTGAIDARLIFFSRDTRGTVIFQIATSCTATSGSTVDDIAFNTADVFTTITLNATADAQWETNKTGINVTGCSPLNTLQVKISRATDTASSRVSVKGLELTVRRAL